MLARDALQEIRDLSSPPRARLRERPPQEREGLDADPREGAFQCLVCELLHLASLRLYAAGDREAPREELSPSIRLAPYLHRPLRELNRRIRRPRPVRDRRLIQAHERLVIRDTHALHRLNELAIDSYGRPHAVQRRSQEPFSAALPERVP